MKIVSIVAALICVAGLQAMPVAAKAPRQPSANQAVWIPAWYAAPEPAGNALQIKDTTLRQIVRVSAGGSTVRVRLSNAYGGQPLRLDEIHLARRVSGSRIDAASDRAVTFNGKAGVTLAPGAYALSDPIALDITADRDLAVSVYAAGPAALSTVHDIQRSVLYTAPGRMTDAAEFTGAPGADIGLGQAFPWIAEVDVSGGEAKSAIIAFGDSITDGYGLTPDRGETWPEVFGRRLREVGIPLSVVNGGISGNRLLRHGQWARFGDNGLARFDRDVLAQPNVSAVIVLIGINDLGHAQGPGSQDYVSAEDIIDGLSQMAVRAHERGLSIYAGTLTPFEGTVFSGYYSNEKEARRVAINTWLRTSRIFDGVFDFDLAVRQPDAPTKLRPEFDVGDHLHPNDAGAAAMANAIPLGFFDGARP